MHFSAGRGYRPNREHSFNDMNLHATRGQGESADLAVDGHSGYVVGLDMANR